MKTPSKDGQVIVIVSPKSNAATVVLTLDTLKDKQERSLTTEERSGGAMHETIEIYHYGQKLTVTVATTQDSHSHYSEKPEHFLALKQNIRNVLRNVDGVMVK